MATEHHIFCGGIGPHIASSDPPRLMLNLWNNQPGRNVRLTIEDLHEKFYKSSPSQFHDLVEIATYIFCADNALKRGARDVQTMGENWRRRLHFHIPVRNAELWNSANVKSALVETLDFLSDDFYEFTFEKATGAPPMQDYFNFDTGAAPKQKPEQVMMFSGGLDSLAGAIEEIVVKKRKVALVNHLSTPKFSRRYGELCRRLMEKSGEMKPVHVRVEVNKSQDFNKEYTQRSRSFLYASLGATVAMMLDLRKLCFYENGVVSLNLPVSAQVVGGRATRTTHPRVLAGFQNLLSLLAGETFSVENPFLWKTKGEVAKIIVAAECGPLILPSRSCAHTWETTNEHTHCGVCSQCIDRRFGIIAAQAEEFDPVTQYRLDVFTQSLPKDEDKIMGAAYLEKAIQCENLKDVPQFITDNTEVMRVLRYIEGTRSGVAGRIFDLHKRHAKEVTEGLRTMLGRNLDGVIKGTLPPDCLLRISYETGSPLTMPAVAVEKSRSKGAATAPTENILEKIHKEIAAVRTDFHDMKTIKDRLVKMQGEKLFAFTDKIEPESFRILCAVLANGDVAKASRALNISDSTMRSRISEWDKQGPVYKVLGELVRWRKEMGRKETVSLPESILKNTTPSADFAGVLSDVLDEVLAMNDSNWSEKADALAELLRPYVPR